MNDSIETSDREAEDPREPIRLPVREMRDEPVPNVAAAPRAADLYARLHNLSKMLEDSGRIEDQDCQDAYPAILDAMAAVAALEQREPHPPSRHCMCPECAPNFDDKASPPTSADVRDAARYRWLRSQHWSESEMCVVRQPKKAVVVGYECPSSDWLDAAIDAAIAATKEKA